MVIISKTIASIEKVWLAKCIASFRPFDVNSLENSGTKAELNAPSPKILRKILGNLKAAKNASAA